MSYSFLCFFLKLERFCETHPPVHQISHMERFCRQALAVSHLKRAPPGQRSTDTPVRQKWMPLRVSFFSNPFNVSVPPTQHRATFLRGGGGLIHQRSP